jgi:16S rRNA (guanine966-N2)-methyltransferase
MRIVAGKWRGRALAAPKGTNTRPTSDRLRQALFDMLLHAGWAGRAVVEGAAVLDAFAGTGALGLEALSRGATQAFFMEGDPAALAALHANIAACRAGASCRVAASNALAPPPGQPCSLIFLDPPYMQGLVPRAVAALSAAGWIAQGGLLVAETGRDEALDLPGECLAERAHGAARVSFWRQP